MRTTLLLKDDLLKEAMRATGVQEKTRLVHLGLQSLIREAATTRLIRLYGRVKRAQTPDRRRRSCF